MFRTVSYPLKPTKGQERRLEHLLGQQRYLYNSARAERVNAWDDSKHRIAKRDQFANLNGLSVTNPPLAQYGITPARGTLIRLDLAFAAFFRRCREAKPGVKVDSFDLIAHEDLRIANLVLRPAPRSNNDGTFAPNGAAAKGGLNKSIQDAGWGQLLRFIAYKAEEAGREVIAVDPRNTSRTCSMCAHCEAGNRPTQAKFLCLSCGFAAHADENAAVNILRAGLALRDAAQAAERVVQEEMAQATERNLAQATSAVPCSSRLAV